jgi:hypothetical protein
LLTTTSVYKHLTARAEEERKTKMNISIRPAIPDDAGFLAWAMLTAARSHLTRGIWDVSLGLPEQDCLIYLEKLALTNTVSWGHYSTFLIVKTSRGRGRGTGKISLGLDVML